MFGTGSSVINEKGKHFLGMLHQKHK